MNLDEAKTIFQDKGLFVKDVPSSYGEGLLIAGQVDRSGKIWCLTEITRIYIRDNEWIFDTVTGVPLPIHDDVIYKTQSLDKAVDITLERYFGQPFILENWIFPIQKHPEWNLEIIKNSLLNAKTISRKRWKVLKKQYEKRFHNLFHSDNREQWWILWETYPELDFRQVDSTVMTKRELWMSRDTKKMYKIIET